MYIVPGMRNLRYLCLVIGLALLLLLLRCIKAEADLEALALAPATAGGGLLMIVNVQQAYTQARRRLVAYCWLIAAALTGVSVLVALNGGVGRLVPIFLALLAVQSYAAVHAWRRRKVYRLKFYNKYLDS